MRVFISKKFDKFVRKEGITEDTLLKIIRDAEKGKVDADYGGGVIKQRIARPNQGKSGGYRTIILFCRNNRAFFVYGFLKSERGNIDKTDEQDFKELAKILFAASDEDLNKLIKQKSFFEVPYHEQD